MGSFSKPKEKVFSEARRKIHVILFLAVPNLAQPEINYPCLEQEVGPDSFHVSLPACMNLCLYRLLYTFVMCLYVLYVMSIDNTPCFKHRREIVKPPMSEIAT